LSQEVDGVRQPIAYVSRTLTAHERKASSVYELERLAVLFGTDKFRRYLEHREFLLETDNQALSWLLSHPRQLWKTGRWVARISALKIDVRHIRGTQNIVADTLSRMFEVPGEEEKHLVPCLVTLIDFPLAFQNWKELQQQDPELRAVIHKIKQGEKLPRYNLGKGVLYWGSDKRRRRKLVVPAAARAMIFSYFHESAVGGTFGQE
jgi:hypothetical protein